MLLINSQRDRLHLKDDQNGRGHIIPSRILIYQIISINSLYLKSRVECKRTSTNQKKRYMRKLALRKLSFCSANIVQIDETFSSRKQQNHLITNKPSAKQNWTMTCFSFLIREVPNPLRELDLSSEHMQTFINSRRMVIARLSCSNRM